MDDAPEEKTYPLSPARMSKTPSWVMLGFVLGGLCAWSLLREAPAPNPAPAPKPPPRREVQVVPITRIEGVFAEYGRLAIWEHDLTEVALWSPATGAFSECYEVMRSGEALYFRSIPRLTRPLLTHGARLPDCPLQYTETEEMRREWLRNGPIPAPEKP